MISIRTTLSVLTFFLFVLSYTLQAQTRIMGTVTDKENKALEGIMVTIVGKENTTFAYAISDAQGAFVTELTSSLDSVKIVARALSYAEQVFVVPNKNLFGVRFTLQPKDIQLKEVAVKASSPITRSNDTISYNVAAFTDRKDRAIADVLKKMPGIEVESNGRILYEGKPIQKFYIEGLDLLEGKYNLASNNLPADAVTSVQVLENHQPIRLLDSLVASYSTSLNIKLKSGVTTTGAANVGAGAGHQTPLWNVNLSPMLFTKKQQIITSYQTNNTGDDAATDLKALTVDELREEQESSIGKQDLLSIQQLSPPQFASRRYLFNNIHLGSTNYLLKLKKDLQLRINASYLNDYQKQEGEAQSIFYFPEDTVQLTEITNNSLFLSSAQTSLTLFRNAKKNYFENNLRLNGFWDSQRGIVRANQIELKQQLNNPYFAVSNKLEAIQPIGRQLVSFSSVLAYNKTPQQLSVTPGRFEEIVNDGLPYDRLDQRINLTTFYTDNSAGITKSINRWTLAPKIGFQVQRQKLESELIKIQSEEETQLQKNAENDLDWRRSKYYGQLEATYKTQRLNITTTLPVSFWRFDIEDRQASKSQQLNKFTAEPSIFARYEISPLWRGTASFRFRNQFGNINQLNYAYILRDYRNLQKNDAPLPSETAQYYMLGLAYKNTLKSVFSHLNYTFSTLDKALIYQNSLQENGALVTTAYEQPNNVLNHSINWQASRYFSEVKTTFSIGSNLYIGQRQQILNSKLTEVQNHYVQLNLKANTTVTEWLSFDYKWTASVLTNTVGKVNTGKTTLQEHNLSINLYPSDNHYIGAIADYYQNNTSQLNLDSFFGDLLYRYRIEKRKIDVELRWANVFNTSRYTSVYTDGFLFIENTYKLRPSQFQISVKFSL